MTETWQRYSRQMLFGPIGKEGQEKLLNSGVLIIGMGALGTALANHFVRAGVGLVRFVDRDYVERSNLQRQMLFDETDADQAFPKAEAAKRKLQAINSSIIIEPIIADVTADNIESMLDGINVVLDGTDNFETRFLVNDACYKHEIPFIYGGAVSSRGMIAPLIPGKTPCLRCLMPGSQQSGQTCDTVGVISPVVDIVASYQAVEALKILTGHIEKTRNGLYTFDIWHNQQFEMKFQQPKSDCPTCQTKRYPSLHAENKESATVLCGRETVQINAGTSFDLEEWATRLEKTGANVKRTPFLLRVELNEGERFVMFPDGRTLVQGTEDVSRAKTLYSRYIGL